MTAQLRARDLRTVLDVAGTIGEADGLPAYRAAVLDLAPRLVEGDVYGYNEVPPRRAQPLVNMSETPTDGTWQEALVRLSEEHPLVVHYRATGDPWTRAISDLMSTRTFVSGQFYRDVLRHADGRDQLAVSIPGTDGLVIGLAVNRTCPGFSARDHAMFDAIRPFLVQGYRKATDRDRDRALAAGLGSAADASGHPVVLADRRGRVVHLTPEAAELLDGSGLRAGEAVPEPFAKWLRHERARGAPRPLVSGGIVARLVPAETGGLDAIVLSTSRPGLSAARLRVLGLTAREADVLALAADGLTNAAAADRLGIRSATVAKHLQHVNEKLGTGSRSAAVARARELLDGES